MKREQKHKKKKTAINQINQKRDQDDMGRRKSKARVLKKERAKVPTTFDCPHCNHAKTVEAVMDMQKRQGTVRCRICGEHFMTEITNLSDPVDIYSEWIDELEEMNRVQAPAPVPAAARRRREEDMAAVGSLQSLRRERAPQGGRAGFSAAALVSGLDGKAAHAERPREPPARLEDGLDEFSDDSEDSLDSDDNDE